ncbi:hypothetical protein HBH51_259910, partial [Parastagonospora nodorum]
MSSPDKVVLSLEDEICCGTIYIPELSENDAQLDQTDPEGRMTEGPPLKNNIALQGIMNAGGKIDHQVNKKRR